jgi:hypothetical protein
METSHKQMKAALVGNRFHVISPDGGAHGGKPVAITRPKSNAINKIHYRNPTHTILPSGYYNCGVKLRDAKPLYSPWHATLEISRSKAQTVLDWIRFFVCLFVCLIISAKETCPAFSKHLKLTIRGFSTREIIRCHRNFLIQKNFFKYEHRAAGYVRILNILATGETKFGI